MLGLMQLKEVIMVEFPVRRLMHGIVSRSVEAVMGVMGGRECRRNSIYYLKE